MLSYLNCGAAILHDEEDAELVRGYPWALQPNGYVAKKVRVGRRSVTVLLHRVILRCPRDKEVDHRNGDILDFRRDNLRVCTLQQNRLNKGKYRSNKSGYKGVYSEDRSSGLVWHAQIRCNKIKHYLGCYPTAEEASARYREAARQLHGDFARP